MKAIKAYMSRALPIGTIMDTCDNSGAKQVKLVSVRKMNTTKRRIQEAGVGDLVTLSVLKGKQDMRRKVVLGVIVRQKKSYKRPDGSRVCFQDNSVVIVKDIKGNPKGTIFKGPVAKEAAERWPGIAKVSSVVV